MKWKGWERIPLRIADNAGNTAAKNVMAIAPLIISASRSTDIPAFYGDWFMARLAAGYLQWKSPFGGTPLYISLSKARVFIFWSKNPAPFFHHIDTLDRYFQFTRDINKRIGQPFVRVADPDLGGPQAKRVHVYHRIRCRDLFPSHLPGIET